jgi:hypothetical protein
VQGYNGKNLKGGDGLEVNIRMRVNQDIILECMLMKIGGCGRDLSD